MRGRAGSLASFPLDPRRFERLFHLTVVEAVEVHSLALAVSEDRTGCWTPTRFPMPLEQLSRSLVTDKAGDVAFFARPSHVTNRTSDSKQYQAPSRITVLGVLLDRKNVAHSPCTPYEIVNFLCIELDAERAFKEAETYG